jgi:hypothetical protein
MNRLLMAAALVIFVGLLAAGCGRSPGRHVAQLGTTTTGGGSSNTAARPGGWLAFSACMRSDGVAGYPDPTGSGPPPKKSLQQLGASSARFDAAQSSCRRLLPNGGRPPDQAEQQQVRANALRFSQCIRSHGVEGFPDPANSGRIPDPATVGVNQGSPRFEAANRACGRYRPPYMPSNAAYNSWARAHGQ